QYPHEGYGLQRTVNVLRLRAGGSEAELKGRVALPEDAGQLVLGGGHAWMVRNQWWYDEVTGDYNADSSLQAVDLQSHDGPTLTGETKLPVPYASLYQVDGRRAVVGTWWYVSGLMVYDVTDADQPRFESHVRTQGWVSDILEHQGDLYLATGPYGVRRLELE
ncbi:MAG: hypothetical protein ABI333_08205, partial [bacterium]